MHTGDVGAAGKAVAANGGHALRDVQLGDFLIVQVDLMGHVERVGILVLELDAAPRGEISDFQSVQFATGVENVLTDDCLIPVEGHALECVAVGERYVANALD